eukprot:scaffold91_cov254-Pinguiococcus_pyrenoidosus.AAC.45
MKKQKKSGVSSSASSQAATPNSAPIPVLPALRSPPPPFRPSRSRSARTRPRPQVPSARPHHAVQKPPVCRGGRAPRRHQELRRQAGEQRAGRAGQGAVRLVGRHRVLQDRHGRRRRRDPLWVDAP